MTKLSIVSTTLLISCMSGIAVAYIAYTGSACDSDTYYKPHPSDCALFFQCSPNGTYILLICPPDLHFNPVLNVCDYPQLAGCSNDNEGSTNDPGNSEPSTITDTSTTDSTSTTENSNTTETTTAISTELPTEPSTEPPNHPTEPSTEPSTDPSTDPTTEDTTHVSTDECAPNEYQPDESNCEAFYVCFNGIFIKLLCPSGTHFNENTRKCDAPEEAGCDSEFDPSSNTPETTTELSTEPSTEPSTEISTEYTTEDTTYISTDECAPNEYQPDESNCEAFYVCINGMFIKLLCPSGTHYNANTRNCDKPEVAGCDSEVDPSSNIPETTTEISTEPSTELSTEYTTEDTTYISTDECAPNEYQPDESNCQAFYICINGRFIELFCPSGTHYNADTRKCDEPELAGCNSTGSVNVKSFYENKML